MTLALRLLRCSSRLNPPHICHFWNKNRCAGPTTPPEIMVYSGDGGQNPQEGVMKELKEMALADPIGGRRYVRFQLPCAICKGVGWRLVPERQAARIRQAPPRFICRRCELAGKP